MDARQVAFHILLNFEKSLSRLDVLLEQSKPLRSITAKERKMVYHLVHGVVRQRSLFDWKLGLLHHGDYKKSLHKFKVILRLALYELDFMSFIPPHATLNEYVKIARKYLSAKNAGTINAILRTYLREGNRYQPETKFKYPETQLSIRYSFPEWMIKRWVGLWGKEFVEQMCQSFNQRPQFSLRINQSKTDVQYFIKLLQKEKIVFQRSEIFSNVLKITDIQALLHSELLDKGLCSIQDESGLIAVESLAKIRAGDKILDACAAPGSKFTAILEKGKTDFELTGIEINRKRLSDIIKNCNRLGLHKWQLVNADASRPPLRKKFDQIIVDAPCSGLGTIKKNPDVKWRRELQDIFAFQKQQLSILERMDDLLKIGGYLIYCTCTIDPAENETVIETYINKKSGRFKIISPPKSLENYIVDLKYIRTFPHLHQMEGSFVAKLQKIG